MLTNERMGLLALAILWVNVLLIAADAGKQLAALLSLRSRLADLARGRVLEGSGPAGAIAAHRVEQVGRAAGDGGAVVFQDRLATGVIHGGVIALDGGGELLLDPLGVGDEAEVWVDPGEAARAGGCPSEGAFEEALAAARKAKGFVRTLSAPIPAGTAVFASRDGRLLAVMDPRALVTRKAALAAAFIAADLALAAVLTGVALWPPIFGPVSTVGGALCLGFFLGVQPAGTALRAAVLVPSRAPVGGAGGRWTRAAKADAPAAHATS